jgi:hypothetical protein
MRDVLEYASSHARWPVLADVDGLSEASDVAVSPTAAGLTVAIVNHEPSARAVEVRPLDVKGVWFDAVSKGSLGAGTAGVLRLDVPAGGVRVVAFRREEGRRP